MSENMLKYRKQPKPADPIHLIKIYCMLMIVSDVKTSRPLGLKAKISASVLELCPRPRPQTFGLGLA